MVTGYHGWLELLETALLEAEVEEALLADEVVLATEEVQS